MYNKIKCDNKWAELHQHFHYTQLPNAQPVLEKCIQLNRSLCFFVKETIFWVVILANKPELYSIVLAKFMQIHACNLSQRLTSVPYCRGEGWRATWSWDNQLSFIIDTLCYLKALFRLTRLDIFWVSRCSRYGSVWEEPVEFISTGFLRASGYVVQLPDFSRGGSWYTVENKINEWTQSKGGLQCSSRPKKLAGLQQRRHIAWNNNIELLKIPMTISFCGK